MTLVKSFPLERIEVLHDRVAGVRRPLQGLGFCHHRYKGTVWTPYLGAMRVAFHSSQLSYRGTEIALYDYAHYGQVLLGLSPVIVSPAGSAHHPDIIEKFRKRFPVYLYQDRAHLEQIIRQENCEAFYAIKAGVNDGLVFSGIRNWVHAVFGHRDPHGDRYAYVSEWLARDQGSELWVPHIVSRPHETHDNLRMKLGIPTEAFVFGRYGGAETFDLPFVKKSVLRIAHHRRDFYFLFMGTNSFSAQTGIYRKSWKQFFASLSLPKGPMPRVIFLPAETELLGKQLFINTCDAMLHGRGQGESFGLAVGEFSISGKPVITWLSDKPSYEQAHISILGEKGLYYRNAAELERLLVSMPQRPISDYDAYSHSFNPEAVMIRFKKVFIDE